MARPDPEALAPLLRERLRGEVKVGEPLARHISLGVGGPADLFVVPADLDDLRELLRLLAADEVPYQVIGGGYNLLVRDGGLRGVAVSLGRFQRRERVGESISLGAGVTTGTAVRFAAGEGLAGIEFLAGIPGTIGGAVTMNAGAHGDATADRLRTLTTLSGEQVQTRERADLLFGYRFLTLSPGEIIIEADFELTRDDPAEIRKRMDALLAHRRASQRVGYPNAGSFFRNPPGQQAWRLIDQAGLRGCRIGGAEVSEVHTNFLVNRGEATARHFLDLARLVKEKVQAVSGVVLEEEVRIIGEDP